MNITFTHLACSQDVIRCVELSIFAHAVKNQESLGIYLFIFESYIILDNVFDAIWFEFMPCLSLTGMNKNPGAQAFCDEAIIKVGTPRVLQGMF